MNVQRYLIPLNYTMAGLQLAWFTHELFGENRTFWTVCHALIAVLSFAAAEYALHIERHAWFHAGWISAVEGRLVPFRRRKSV